MKQLYTLLLVLLISLPSFAQSNFKPGYILLPSGEKEEGLLDYRGEVRRTQEIAFKKSEGSTPKSYVPSDLAGYGFDKSQLYLSKPVPQSENLSGLYFVEALVQGEANLYFFRESDVVERYFIEKSEGELIELKEENRRIRNSDGKVYNSVLKSFVGVLTIALNDCPDIQKAIDKTQLKHSSLKSLVSTYNKCVAPETHGFVQEKGRNFKVSAGVLLGGATQQLTITGEDEFVKYYGDPGSSKGVTGGFIIDLNVPKINDKFSIYSGVFYSSLQTQTYTKASTLNGSKAEHWVNFDAQFLTTPLMLRYVYPKGKVRPFVNAGPTFSMLLSMDGERRSLYNKGTSYEKEYISDAMEKYKKTNFGLMGGAGIIVPVSDKLDFVTELRYSKRGGFSKAMAIDTKIQEASFSVGILFK